MIGDNKDNLISVLIIIIGFLLIFLIAKTLPTTKEIQLKLQRGEITEEQYWEWVEQEQVERAEWPY